MAVLLDSRTILFASFWLFLLLQRLAELVLSHRNEVKIKAQGGVEIPSPEFFYMKLVHTFWFIASFIEFFARQPKVSRLGFFVFLTLLAIGQGLRYVAITQLGYRWNVKIFVIPHFEPVQSKVFQWLRHPNYIGVVLEIAAFPLMFQLYSTAAIFSLLNLIVLYFRIRHEEKALDEHNQYHKYFARPMFAKAMAKEESAQ